MPTQRQKTVPVTATTQSAAQATATPQELLPTPATLPPLLRSSWRDARWALAEVLRAPGMDEEGPTGATRKMEIVNTRTRNGRIPLLMKII